MKVTRIGSDREIVEEVTVVDIEIDEFRIRITPNQEGGIKVHMIDGYITVSPCCANEICIDGRDW